MNLNKNMLYAAGLLSATYFPFVSPVFADMQVKQVLEITSQTNPQILGDIATTKARQNVIRQAEAGYLPKLDASYSAGPERVVNRFRETTCQSAQQCSAERWRSNPAVNLTQNVFDGFKTVSDVDRATTDYIQGEKKVDETLEQLSFRAFNAYADVRRFQRMLREAKRNLEAHKAIAGKVEQLIKGGRASTADRYTVESRLATSANAVTDIQGDLDNAVAEFKALVGIEPDRLQSAKIPDSYIPPCLQDAIEIARQKNKSVILARASVDVALSEMNSAEAAFYPKLTVEAGANRAKNNAGEKGHGDTYNVLGVVRYNLYNGGADTARLGEVTERIVQLRYEVENQLRTAEEETRKSWADMIRSRAASGEQRKAVTALRLERDAFQKQYEIGTRTLIDVLGAINEYFLARGALITSDAAQDVAEARLLASMGLLTDKFSTARHSPKLYSQKESEDLIKTDYTGSTCKKDGGDHPNVHLADEPEEENVLKQVAAEVPEGKEYGINFMDDLAAVFSKDTPAAVEKKSEEVTVRPNLEPAAQQEAPNTQTGTEYNFFSNLAGTFTGSSDSTAVSQNAPAAAAQKTEVSTTMPTVQSVAQAEPAKPQTETEYNFFSNIAGTFTGSSDSTAVSQTREVARTSAPVPTAAPQQADTARERWFFFESNDDRGTYTDDSVLTPTAYNIEKQTSRDTETKSPANTAETSSQDATADQSASGVGEWFSSVFSADSPSAKTDATPKAQPTTTAPHKKAKPVVMGPGLDVPSEIKSGQEIR
jgi:outer membrane protein, adhesin transport system